MNIAQVSPDLLYMLAGIYGILVLAGLVLRVLRRRRPGADFTELSQRVSSWWVMVSVFTVALILDKTVTLVFLGFVSFLALKEYLSVIPSRRADRRVLFWAYAAIPVQFYWIGIGWYGMFIIFIPVYMFLLLPLRMVLIGEPRGFLQAVGTIHWGLMITVFGLSHAAYLIVLPPVGDTGAGGPGLLLYLIFLTQFNDVAQYFWGKLFGRHPVVPTVSPKKTYEGLIGGVVTTTALALIVGPWLTPLAWHHALIAGLIIGLGGFIGDVNISAVKRDLAIKDSGSLIPGHGGILDRVDSLSFTAPLFFHFVRYLYF